MTGVKIEWDAHARIDLTITDRDRAIWLMKDFDLEAQLLAIKGLLHRNREQELKVSEEIKDLSSHIKSYRGGDDEYQMFIEADWVDRLHDSVFQDAAHSMSAVGLLAPFVESLFVSIFKAIHQRRQSDKASTTLDTRKTASQAEFWDPHFVFVQSGRRTDLVAGIVQLATSSKLTPFLPENYEKVLSALFSYRNKMFHHGFEWPLDERLKFAKRISDEAWPADWFKKSESSNKPWIFYLSDILIETCLKMIDQVLDGVGRYVLATDENGVVSACKGSN